MSAARELANFLTGVTPPDLPAQAMDHAAVLIASTLIIFPLVIYGMNAIAAFVAAGILVRLGIFIKVVGASGKRVSLIDYCQAHCAAGVHRAPMMTLALLCSMGWELGKAMELIEAKRPVVDFPDVYVNSVEQFLVIRR